MTEEAKKKDAKLTDEERKEIENWLKSRVQSMACTFCQKTDSWILGPHKTRVQAAHALIGGTGYPQIVLTCGYCGHTVLFNSIVMGIDKARKAEDV